MAVHLKKLYFKSMAFLLPLIFIYLGVVVIALIFVKNGWYVNAFCLLGSGAVLLYSRGSIYRLAEYLRHLYGHRYISLKNKILLYGILPAWGLLSVYVTYSMVVSLVRRLVMGM